MENVDLAIGSVLAHDLLLDWLANTDLLDQIVQWRQLALPVLGRDDLDDAGFHAIFVYLFHLHSPEKSIQSARPGVIAQEEDKHTKSLKS